MDQRLRVIGGPDKGTSFQLPVEGNQTLGRSKQHNEMCLHDPAVDRVHCQVEIEDGRVFVSDFDSDTGTFVNGAQVRRHELKHGDIIRIGDTEIQFQSIGGAPATAPSTPAALQPAAAPPPPSRTAPPAENLDSLTGTTLGHYVVGPILGRGHYGAVFRAQDRKEDRIVALKVLPGFPKSEEEMQQFAQAIKAALPLRHPNVVTIYGAGRTATLCWLAMEYVEGESAAQMLQWIGTSGVPDWQQAFRLAVYLCRALYFLHEKELNHRNITPHNVLFRSIDRQVKLGDWALTRALAGSSLRQSTLRAKLLSELPFLSPEQTQPRAPADIRSDIYSVGAVVYGVLTGRPPFAGDSPAETISQIRQAAPTAPRQERSSVPEPFEAIVLKMLAKNPQERQQTPAELLAQLARIAPEPV
jgi:serine/threonine protein kinase